MHEFLPLFVGQPLVDDAAVFGPAVLRPGRAFMPVEFQTGAYRFGDSMVRPSYRANLNGDWRAVLRLRLRSVQHPRTRRSYRSPIQTIWQAAQASRRFIDWQTFFDFGDGQVKPTSSSTRRSRVRSSPPIADHCITYTASRLPQRTLLRHITWSLPSGQEIAKRMRIAPLQAEHFPELTSYGLGLESSTPLFYYILREAGLTETTQPTLVPSPPPTPTTTTTGAGLRLGPVGGRIVAEVILGLLRADPTSYASADPHWRPTLPTRSGAIGDFRMTDFLAFAGVDPTTRGQ